MGVRGLTTFIAQRSEKYLLNYELHDTCLVVDGNSIACQLYNWHCKSYDCFGGDYDKYGLVVTSFFQILSECNIKPYVIFDGGYEKRKLKTVFNRMRSRIQTAKTLNGTTEGSACVFPLFLSVLFVEIITNMGVKCVRCDQEADSEAAALAQALNCPILSYDSDFYIFDVLYIPFSNMELVAKLRKGRKFIPCKVYHVEKFLDSFGGLSKEQLPLLAVLLGNDYVSKASFSWFFSQLKMVKNSGTPQHKLIKSLIVWLKNETPDSALKKILGRYRISNRAKVAEKIQNAIQGYQHPHTDLLDYFNLNVRKPQKEAIKMPSLVEINSIPEDLNEEEVLIDSEDDELIEEESEEEKHQLPCLFQKKYRNCEYPACFMDIFTSNTYYCTPQVEDSNVSHSHTISLEILSAIHTILKFPLENPLICVARNEDGNIKKLSLPLYTQKVPLFHELEGRSTILLKQDLLDILHLEKVQFDLFPESWHLFLVALQYWITRAKIGRTHIYSLVLCGIIHNDVDSKLPGICRSAKSLSKVVETTPLSLEITDNITQAFERIDLNDSVKCLKKLLPYFQMEEKMRNNHRLFDNSIVHDFAQFQSVYLHINYLNNLLEKPFSSMIISKIYDGTFLYNMTTNLNKRSDLLAYIQLLLKDSPKILLCFELFINHIENELVIDCDTNKRKRRRRKRKSTKEEVIEIPDNNVQLEEDADFDENNMFSLLNFVNK